uniref:Ion transport peptide n=2 Tax=Sarcoptes scabiei TaxID=52283 RepID=A0A834RHL7_SARSC
MNKSLRFRDLGTLFFCLFMAIVARNSIETRTLAGSFSTIGCLGTHDKAIFAELDRICSDCFMIYRDDDLHASCRENCFVNKVFGQCIDALMLSHEKKKLTESAYVLFG